MSVASLRVLSIVEGTWITGPIKPLVMFARLAREATRETPPVDLRLLTTARLAPGQTEPANALIDSVRAAELHIDVIHERRAWDPRVIGGMSAAIQAWRPHIVETHQVKCHFLLAQALLWSGLRRDFAWIAYHHGYTKATLKLTLYEELDRWTLRRADHVVTVCKPFADHLARRGVNPAHLSVISNAIERKPAPSHDELQRLREQMDLRTDDRVILAIGRLSPEKGHRHLLEAFGRLHSAAAARTHLIIVGDGPERANLEQQSAPFRNRVHFAGHQQNVWPYYFIADVFALPSLTEGSPLVLFEAMAANAAIVSTRVGGVPETIADEQSGLLVAPGDPVALAAAISRVLQDAALREKLSSEATQASARYSPEQYRQRLTGLYEEVLGRQRHTRASK